MQRNTIRENIEIFIVTKNSTFRYQLLLWYTEGKRKLTSLHKVRAAKLKNTAQYNMNTNVARAITATPDKAEKDRDFASVGYSSSPVAGQKANTLQPISRKRQRQR